MSIVAVVSLIQMFYNTLFVYIIISCTRLCLVWAAVIGNYIPTGLPDVKLLIVETKTRLNVFSALSSVYMY